MARTTEFVGEILISVLFTLIFSEVGLGASGNSPLDCLIIGVEAFFGSNPGFGLNLCNCSVELKCVECKRVKGSGRSLDFSGKIVLGGGLGGVSLLLTVLTGIGTSSRRGRFPVSDMKSGELELGGSTMGIPSSYLIAVVDSKEVLDGSGSLDCFGSGFGERSKLGGVSGVS